MPSALAIYSLASMAAVLAIAVEPVLLIRNGEWFSQVRLELPARFIIETARSLSVLHTLVLVRGEKTKQSTLFTSLSEKNAIECSSGQQRLLHLHPRGHSHTAHGIW